MSDEQTSASAMLSGEGEHVPAQQEQTGNVEAQWYGDVDESLTGYIQNKGWQSPKDAINSYVNLEKLIGADKAGNTVVIPKEGDQEGLNALYDKLGRPADKDSYQLEAPEGSDSDLVDWFKGQAHSIGLNNQQAQTLLNNWQEMAGGMVESQTLQTQQQQEQDLADLKKEWGMQFDANVMSARKAAKQFGIDTEAMNKMENALGTKGLMEFMTKIGKGLGEHTFEEGNGQGGGFGMTPAAAQAKISELMGNSEFTNKYLDASHPGHKHAMEQMTKLQAMAYPE